ncbi:MAG TPA: ABC transporter ATP-binding protein [Longimicrobium sp.]|jgi:lipopolysaccharide transport system ATP-binding protein|uniref:ABC transporter ATP-binding protein n=1 Tax=Longimicrobium sp. TaxID=2029185 RepID=UPI002EDB6A81
MSNTAIRATGLGKSYRIGAAAERSGSLREALSGAGRRALRGLRSRPHETVWALRDVSFEVGHGEALGIIGRNGAGKSTLLKILSRITEPTTGRADVYGRVGSLLEVGTGFHPELTGRDNVFLNGSILGMDREYIARRFDEIVDFSGVERFIDTPVKRYSSGMYLRLAFAVAAHLEPEILIIDEVLAVGDASFQKKCLGKMEDVAHEGRTVLFVSHDMAAVSRLCGRTLLLDQGGVLAHGATSTVLQAYLQSGLGTTAERRWNDPAQAPGDGVARLRAVRVHDEAGHTREAIDIRRPAGIGMEFDVLTPGHVLAPNYHVFNEQGVCVFVAVDTDPSWRDTPRPAGRYTSTAWIPGNLLAEGALVVSVALSTLDPVTVHFHERDAVALQVVDSLEGDSARGSYAGPLPGAVRPLLRWTTQFAPAAAVRETLNLKQPR